MLLCTYKRFLHGTWLAFFTYPIKKHIRWGRACNWLQAVAEAKVSNLTYCCTVFMDNIIIIVNVYLALILCQSLSTWHRFFFLLSLQDRTIRYDNYPN